MAHHRLSKKRQNLIRVIGKSSPSKIGSIMADILILVFVLLFLAVAYLVLCWVGDIHVARATKRRRVAKSAPEDGSGLLAKSNSQ